MTPEEQLAGEILRQAIADACAPWRGQVRTNKGGGGLTNAEIVEAIRFWADDAGEWAESRATICGVAGAAESYVRRLALQQITVARGYCPLENRAWVSRATKKSVTRRVLAAKAASLRDGGATYRQIGALIECDLAEVKRLVTLGRIRARRQEIAA